ncbi:hypothetical protein B0J13DRAFT_595300 [Dactylonectria estremocensis]|uniref:Uncharacterized protein n=1 Tax=Dactylonectria estremocensis TaxID=1079267 RepID=A0A9P9EWW5_9HYPO|nr:hypothetical protein B0J13DRAFT_595300 [Dactylonectria estremocensis]
MVPPPTARSPPQFPSHAVAPQQGSEPASTAASRFTREDFKKFQRADDHATKESRVTASVMPIIEGDPGDTKCVASDIPFTNLDHLTDGSLVCAKPDLYCGARLEQLHKDIRRALGNPIVPSTQFDLPVVLNNFVEIKGPDGLLSVATRQALYDIKGWSLTSDPETFRQGAAAFRNGRDWAKTYRDQVIA